MDDVLKVIILVGSLVGIGVGTYAGVTVVSFWRRRLDKQWGPPALPPDELEAIHERLGAVDRLEGRVGELEERLDFTERLLAQQHKPEALPSGSPSGQH